MKLKMLSMALLCSTILLAENTKPIKAKLQKAVVYLQGAHLYYNETVNLSVGINDIVFENISPNINATSLQANTREATVMEVRHAIKYWETPTIVKTYEREIAHVLDSLEDFKFLATELNNKSIVVSTEKNLLLNNKLMKGELMKDSLLLLRESLVFLRAKLNELYEQELKIEKNKAKCNKVVNKLNERYEMLINLQNSNGETNEEEAQPTNQVVVTIFAETAGPAQVNFNYLIAEASWVPQYDLQATTQTNNFQLKYFADVVQNSGLDWKNTSLTLSTSNPNEANFKPELTPWYLSFLEFKQTRSINYLSNTLVPVQATVESKSQQATTDNDGMKREYNASANATIIEKPLTDYIYVTQNLIRMEYEIKLNYNIASDGRSHRVLINQRSVPMLLAFAAVPKLSEDAFLQAKIVGWEDLNIIPGNARLYFDGTYVGEMLLDASSNTDTLSVNLGRDKTIAISRKKIKEKFKVKFIDNEKVEIRTIEIAVRNTKGITVEMDLEDQIPIVQGTEEIKVNLIDNDKAELDEPTGKLKWHIKLGAKESKKITFTYEIRYPKNKPVNGL
ncbi:MAG: mucoidy inhibitor MuiA family protein [Bacteroidota bacterium]